MCSVTQVLYTIYLVVAEILSDFMPQVIVSCKVEILESRASMDVAACPWVVFPWHFMDALACR